MHAITGGLREADKYLALIRNSFNTSKASYKDIAHNLDDIYNTFGKGTRERREAAELRKQLRESNKIKLVEDKELFSRFSSIMDKFELDSDKITDIIVANKELMKDLNVARSWLDKYNKLLNNLGSNNVMTMKELILLGKAILGRSLELCPMVTGILRNSAVLIVGSNSIIIAYTAPYATYVHENMNVNHNKHKDGHECGGEAKFLEKAAQEFIPNKHLWVDHGGFGDVRIEIGLDGEINYYHYDGGLY